MKIVSLKAFGDFVIAANAVSRINQSVCETNILAGSHLKELAQALNIGNLVQFVDLEENDVPGIFTLKKTGITTGLVSLLRVRHRLGRVEPSADLVFDRIGWREMFIGYGRKIHSLPKNSTNIYNAYSDFFKIHGIINETENSNKVTTVTEVTIIPGSRQPTKTIPDILIEKICEDVNRVGIRAKIVYLEGEKCSLRNRLDIEIIPRSFSALVNKVKGSSVVVSADSLPAHLCYYLNVPVFVFAPNIDFARYWVPKSCITQDALAEFGEVTQLSKWLRSLAQI
jgi:ADP-heptose:LPS heptosyltransferase